MSETDTAYDRIGVGYASTRRTDPRIARQIEEALGEAQSVVNVGAGTGAYEPVDREVTAVEPSAAMTGQRPAGAAPAVRAHAEALPFADDSFDAAMTVLSDHHWRDRAAGLREMRRVARDRVVVLNSDPALAELFWLTRDYLRGFLDLIPDRYRTPGHWRAELESLLGTATDVRAVPVSHACGDGFYAAYWRRPRAYLEREVRNGISVFHRLPAAEVDAALKRLGRDLDDGAWEERLGHLLQLDELDVGLRLVSCELRYRRHVDAFSPR
jgi:SAM-dependent methyltransferase